jgi:hypothetical protein
MKPVEVTFMFKAIRHPLRFIDGILDRIASIIGAVAFSQFPQFFGQYMQRLGGHLAEAQRALAQYNAAAKALGLTLEEYIREHLDSGSEVFVSSGKVIQDMLERVQRLELSYQVLQDATIYNRWLVFMREVDWSIASGTWEDFVPGVPTTVEGLTYALAGLLLGWGAYTLFKMAIAVLSKALKLNGSRVDHANYTDL